jgi:putative transposase
LRLDGFLYDGRAQFWDETMAIDFKGSHFERDIILWGVRWYVAYPISYRQLEEMMGERGVEVDHSALNRWIVRYVPLLEKVFVSRKRPVGGSWRLDETYVRVKGAWRYLYRAVDKAGATVDFLLTAKRDRKAALRFLRKAAGHHGVPEKITIDKSGANTAAIESYNGDCQEFRVWGDNPPKGVQPCPGANSPPFRMPFLTSFSMGRTHGQPSIRTASLMP